MSRRITTKGVREPRHPRPAREPVARPPSCPRHPGVPPSPGTSAAAGPVAAAAKAGQPPQWHLRWPGRGRRVATGAWVVVLAISLVARFGPPPALWLDEAQRGGIARLPAPGL